MPRDPNAPQRITVTRAKTEYGLTEDDLLELECEYCRNPHYRSAPQMRLYMLDEVISLSQERISERAVERQYMIENKLEIDTRRKAARAAVSKASKEVDEAFLDGYASKGCAINKNDRNNCGLPMDVLGLILSKLATSMEPHGIRGPALVAMDLCNASAAFKDMRDAAMDGFTKLAGLISSDHIVPHLDSIIQDHTKVKLPQIKSTARDLGLTTTGTKAEVVSRIVRYMGLKTRPPAWVPTLVMMALKHEKQVRLADIKRDVRNGLHNQDSFYHAISMHCSGRTRYASNEANGIMYNSYASESLRTMRIIASKRWASTKELLLETIWRPQSTPTASSHIQEPYHMEISCACGRAKARDCEKGCCRICCEHKPGMCVRHRVYVR